MINSDDVLNARISLEKLDKIDNPVIQAEGYYSLVEFINKVEKGMVENNSKAQLPALLKGG